MPSYMKTTLAITAAALLAAPAMAESFKVTSPDIAEGQPLTQKHVFNGFGVILR